LISSYFCLCSAGSSSYVIGSSLVIPFAEVNGVDEVDEDGPTRRASMRCRSKPAGEQRQETRGARRLPELLGGLGPSVNGPKSGTHPGVRVARRATWPCTWSGRSYMLVSSMHRHV
jgi:hypothetical protein